MQKPDNPKYYYIDFDAMNLNVPPEKLERLKKINRFNDPRMKDSDKYYDAIEFDPRFPHVNQSLNCHVNYVDYHRCMLKRPGWEACEYYKNAYEQLCPTEWYKKWDLQRKKGIYPSEDAITN